MTADSLNVLLEGRVVGRLVRGPGRKLSFAREVHVDDAALVERARAMADALPVEFARLRKQAVREGLKHPVLGRLQQAFEQQAARCATSLE